MTDLPPHILSWAREPAKGALSDPSTSVDIEPGVSDGELAAQAVGFLALARAAVKDDDHSEARILMGWAALIAATRLYLLAKQKNFSVADIELELSLPRSVTAIDAKLLWKRYHFVADSCDRARWVFASRQAKPLDAFPETSPIHREEAAASQEVLTRTAALLAHVDGLVRSGAR
ncbi:MAG: hypothetical protein ACT4PL_07985 [Phycisphaerales bacterium]